MIPFKVQFDKLTKAYIEGKVNPYRECACFVGNLLNGTHEWRGIRRYRPYGNSILREDMNFILSFSSSIKSIDEQSDGMYSPREILKLENLFLHTLEKKITSDLPFPAAYILVHPNYEEALFHAFCVTLDKLKEIHISKGENVEEFTFIKRKLEVA